MELNQFELSFILTCWTAHYRF